MAKLAAPGGGGTVLKRKTPSELTSELLKRESFVDLIDESPPPLNDSTNTCEVDNVPKKMQSYVQENPSLKKTSNSKNRLVFSNSAAKRQEGSSCLENSVASSEVSKDGALQACQTTAKCSQGNFLSVAELSPCADRSSGLAAVDVAKALRGLAAPESHVSNGLAADSSERCGDAISTLAGNFSCECDVPGQKAPLDLTLKTSMRVLSSCFANWVHRSLMHHIAPEFSLQQCHAKGQNMTGSQDFTVLHSWMYPQSTVPVSLTSVLSSSTADAELEFLRKRQVAWEESFQGLYYMLRNNTCGIFYVCTSQFVVMFTGGDCYGRPKCLCNAYMSQSTRGLRSLLRENGVHFSMPLCHSKVEQVATEDLIELSEIEKHNLGQTRRSRSFSDVDNSPQSLLIFSGNKNVYSLYDLLLNYRSFFTALSATDVPVLCSPVPFQNAAFSSPNFIYYIKHEWNLNAALLQIKCMELRKAEHIAASGNDSIWKDGESALGSSESLCCSIEIKDAFLPPWIICGAFALLGSGGRNFEGSFVMEPSSVGLNVALESTCEKSESEAAGSES